MTENLEKKNYFQISKNKYEAGFKKFIGWQIIFASRKSDIFLHLLNNIIFSFSSAFKAAQQYELSQIFSLQNRILFEPFLIHQLFDKF